MVYEGIASGAMFSLGSGGFMAAYALALGANNLQVGILAALPFITQVVQLPAILAVERFHLTKAIGLPAWLLSNLMWLPIGAVPFLINTPGSGAVALVVGLLALRGLFAPVWLTSWTNWMRDLVPQQVMGGYYARRLAMITTAIIVAGLGGSFFVTWWEGIAAPSDAYSFLLIGGGARVHLGRLVVCRTGAGTPACQPFRPVDAPPSQYSLNHCETGISPNSCDFCFCRASLPT